MFQQQYFGFPLNAGPTLGESGRSSPIVCQEQGVDYQIQPGERNESNTEPSAFRAGSVM